MSSKLTLVSALIALVLGTALLGWSLIPSSAGEVSRQEVAHPPAEFRADPRPQGHLPPLAAVMGANARSAARSSALDTQPGSTHRTEDPPTAEADAGRVRPTFAGLKEALQVLPSYDGTDAGIRAKYAGLGPHELSQVFPLLREISNAEMLDALDLAIEGGLHATEYLPPGASLDTARYDIPGEPINTVVFRAHPLPEGGQECQVVNLDRDRFPDWHVRALENLWVSDRLEEAGLGPDAE